MSVFQDAQQLSLYNTNIMGQTMLQGCQFNCKGEDFGGIHPSKRQLYLNGLLTHIPEYSQKENNMYKSIASTTADNNFLLEIKDVPYQYLSFINHLFVTRSKYEDRLFPIQEIAIASNYSESNCIRVSQITEELAKLCAQQTNSKSRTILLLEHLGRNMPELLQRIKPIYIKKVGVAICRFYLNGSVEQVIIDDRIPLCNVKFLSPQNYWFLLVQKGMAKAVGNYLDLQKFSLSELYQQVTGLFLQPMEQQSQQDLLASNETTFQQGIKYQKQCCLAGEKTQIYRIYLLKNHFVRSLSLKTQNRYNLFRLKVDQKQKISIRLSVLNWKYQFKQQPTINKTFHIALYREEDSSLITTFNKILGNNVYLGLQTIIELQRGSYVILIEGEERSNAKANLVYYSSENVSIKQIISKEGAKLVLRRLNIGSVIDDTF